MRRPLVAVIPAMVLALGGLLAGCGGDDTSAADGATTVDVTLQEFAVLPSTTSVAAGSVTFNATNEGPNDQHEMVVVRTDLDPGSLPTDESGKVDEEGEGIEAIDEIAEFDVGGTESLTVDLDAGNYVLICNIYDETEQEAHYQLGMRTAFTVT
jgi:uncharacterized cupredoxin-like copper-binding protein